ncbi:MAG: glycosyltransferase family 2 protein [Candidatus Omnitrophica bacterium]|nr:glycosyltransferase family 2 protein [Candidatus Omnitrophota bacterium]
MKLSVIIPVYNEEKTIGSVIQKVMAQPLLAAITSREIIVVDDGSTDTTARVLSGLLSDSHGHVVVVTHTRNQGKGAAIRSAVAKVSGDIVLIQDADLEYDPAEYPLMLEPIVAGRADVVYGSRFSGQQAKRVIYFWHYLGNRFLTTLSNLTTNLNLTDMETGFKAFRADVIKELPLRSARFGFEPEITAKVARRGLRVYEVGIGYNGRTYVEGKKITWVDGIRAIGSILRYWIGD